MLLVQFVGDAFVGEADKLRERRVRTTGTARQRWDETGKPREGMTVDRPKIDELRRVAGRTTPTGTNALSAQPIVGENSIGMRLACRSFHAAMRRRGEPERRGERPSEHFCTDSRSPLANALRLAKRQ